MANKKDPYGPVIIYQFGPFRIVRVIKRLTDEEITHIGNTEVEILLEKNVGPDAMNQPVWVNYSEEALEIGFKRLDWDEAEKVVKAVQKARKQADKIIISSHQGDDEE